MKFIENTHNSWNTSFLLISYILQCGMLYVSIVYASYMLEM